MEKTYKKVEIEGEIFIERTTTCKKLIPIADFEARKAKAQEVLDLVNK